MDPFGEVLGDAERQLSSAQLLLRQFRSDPAGHTLQELRVALRDLTSVVHELSDSIRAVQARPQQFGLDAIELSRRIEQVGHINGQVSDIQEELVRLKADASAPVDDPFSDQQQSENPYEVSSQDRQLLYQEAMDEQDVILDSVHDTVQSLRQQANLMSQELEEQATILDDFDTQVERSGDRLARARHRVDWVLRNNRDTLSSCCMWLLVFVLVLLLVIAIIT